MGKYSEHMKGMQKQEPEDLTCSAFGCNLAHLPNQKMCSYHADCVDMQKTTTAIHNNIRWINGYHSMLQWDSDQWGRHKDFLQQHEFLPMNEGELPSPYLTRFHEKLFEVCVL